MVINSLGLMANNTGTSTNVVVLLKSYGPPNKVPTHLELFLFYF